MSEEKNNNGKGEGWAPEPATHLAGEVEKNRLNRGKKTPKKGEKLPGNSMT